jgi:hypothetical protein
MSFRIKGLRAEEFSDLFGLSDEALAARGAVRQTVKEGTHPPCRVSLTDAQPGEEVVLVKLRTSSGRFALSHALCGLCS